MERLQLYDYARSSAAYRVRIALHLKRLDYRSVPVNLLESEQKGDAYRRVNPQGLVPMLVAGDLKLTQSLAIIEWLDAVRPAPRLIPAEPGERARIMAMALTIACDIHPLNNLRVLKYLGGPLDQSEEVRNHWYRHWITEGFAALEAMAETGSGPFLGGTEPGLADICLVPQIYNARRFEVDLQPFPTLIGADAAATALETFAAAHPDQVGGGAAAIRPTSEQQGRR